jgi:hypothetical protein
MGAAQGRGGRSRGRAGEEPSRGRSGRYQRSVHERELEKMRAGTRARSELGVWRLVPGTPGRARPGSPGRGGREDPPRARMRTKVEGKK